MEISIEFAESLGLVPMASGYKKFSFKVLGIFTQRIQVDCTNEEYTKRQENIYKHYSMDREKRTVRFNKENILEAARRQEGDDYAMAEKYYCRSW